MSKKNRGLFIVAACILAATMGCNFRGSFFGNWSDADLTAVTNVTQSASIPANLKSLSVDNRFGAVHIIGTTNGTLGWTWKLAVRARTNSIAQQIASATSCTAKFDGGQLDLALSLPDSKGSDAASDLMKEPHRIQSDFEITVPKSVAVRVQNRFGGVAVADLAGKVDAVNACGRLEIRNIAGAVHAQNSYGALSVSNTGAATLQDRYGQVRAAQIGGQLEAITRYGSLMAHDVRGPARLTNQYGQIDATDVGGSLDADTSFSSLSARDISGPVQLRDRYGGIKVIRVKGDADIGTSYGELSATGIQGDAILKDRNGRVTASGITGSVIAFTSYGAIDVSGAGSNFVCNNRNGAIRLRATSTALTNIEATTSYGTLEVHLPAGLKPAIQARTTYAKIDSDFPVLSERSGAQPLTEIAKGAARISLQNRNGRIRVVRD